MSEDKNTQHLKMLGRRIWSEANDLKRTPEALANETGVPLETVQAVIAGDADEKVAYQLVKTMVKAYPISLTQLWVERDDTDSGVHVMRGASSQKTSRIFDRRDRDGALTPFYEYRDTAMSRLAPFKPEWIQPIRVVSDADPDNPDVAYNHGHLMHQLTFFIGEVNFYWKQRGKTYCREMNTGNSNYITPYVPHSYTSRNPDKLGLIIAITYGDQVRQSLGDFGHMGSVAADELAGDLRDALGAFGAKLGRQLTAESLGARELVERLDAAGIGRARCEALAAAAALPTPQELEVLAEALNVRASDLLVSGLGEQEEVVVRTETDSLVRAYPDGNSPTCNLTELARCRHQPNLKGFEMTLLGGAAEFRHGLHEYMFNYGDTPVSLSWQGGHEAVLDPGDSAYVRPMVAHSLARLPDRDEGHLAVVRTPGALSDAVIDEYASYPAEGRGRASREDRTWF
ncbi:MAG: hypothetical protein HOJ07_16835 [Rhodospirillaceae bacterium]|nr:hypothetical protein [Rhodospirillaceae bacterium]MBT5779793.1 hypothetical protein [Rhodospirillaceae bacterium]MBT6829730.1 hypothetical protein [Rhodospirillaceae bacterium]